MYSVREKASRIDVVIFQGAKIAANAKIGYTLRTTPCSAMLGSLTGLVEPIPFLTVMHGRYLHTLGFSVGALPSSVKAPLTL